MEEYESQTRKEITDKGNEDADSRGDGIFVEIGQ
jgi:hypothetical protein